MALVSNNGNISKNSCFWCIKAVKWVPVLFIVTILAWSYYAYVVELCLYAVRSIVKRVLFLVFYHLICAMVFWAYWQTIFTDVRGISAKFKIPNSEWERLMEASEEERRAALDSFAENLPCTTTSLNGSIRVCEKCQLVKPDRAHHCGVCGECILKMDHHCPWVNNCIGYANYKYFILFLGYALLYCIYVSLTSLKYFILFWQGKLDDVGRFHILFLFFVAAMFAVSLVSLFCYHCYLVALNRTTLEAFRSPVFRTGIDKNGYHVGKFKNFQQVFGENPRKWLLPVFTSLGDGVSFPLQLHHQTISYQTMDQTRTSIGDGYAFPERRLNEDAEQLLGDRSTREEDSDY